MPRATSFDLRGLFSDLHFLLEREVQHRCVQSRCLIESQNAEDSFMLSHVQSVDDLGFDCPAQSNAKFASTVVKDCNTGYCRSVVSTKRG